MKILSAKQRIGRNVFEKIHPDDKNRAQGAFNKFRKDSANEVRVRILMEVAHETYKPLLDFRSVNGHSRKLEDISPEE